MTGIVTNPSAQPGDAPDSPPDAWETFRQDVRCLARAMACVAGGSGEIPVVHGACAGVVAATAALLTAQAGRIVRLSDTQIASVRKLRDHAASLPADVHVLFDTALLFSRGLGKDVQPLTLGPGALRCAIAPGIDAARVAPWRAGSQAEGPDARAATNGLVLVAGRYETRGHLEKAARGAGFGDFRLHPVHSDAPPQPPVDGAGYLGVLPWPLLAPRYLWRSIEDQAAPLSWGQYATVTSPIHRLAELCAE